LLSAHPMLAARDGRLLLAAQSLDALAIGVAGVALPWLVLNGGGSHGQAGLVFSLTVVPYLVFGLLAGAAGDRFPRRSVMLWAHVCQAALAAVIPLWTIAGVPPIGVILPLAFAIGGARVFADAGTFGAVASIVGPEHFGEGQATLSAAWGVGLFAGPALGGLLVAAVGPGFALAAEAGACAAAALLVLAIRGALDHEVDEPAVSSAAAISEGVRYMLASRGIATYTAVIVAFNIAGAGAYGLLVPLLRDHLGLPSGRVGALMAAGELSAIAAAALVGPLTRRFGANSLFAAGLIAGSLTIAGLGLVTGFAGAAVATIPFLLIEAAISIVAIGERQRRAPAELQSRVGIAGRMAALGAVAAGSAIASALSGSLGLGHLYVAMGVASLAVAVVGVPFVLRLE
jgi:predicted MFS family arabinose efflux permease